MTTAWYVALNATFFIMHWMKQFQQIMTKERWKVVTWPFVSGWFVFDCSLLFSVETALRPIRADCNTTKHDFTRPPNTIKQFCSLFRKSLDGIEIHFEEIIWTTSESHTKYVDTMINTAGMKWRLRIARKNTQRLSGNRRTSVVKKQNFSLRYLREKEIGWAKG